MRGTVNADSAKASLAEFISVWSAGGNASLNLTTSGSTMNMSFNVSLGHPGSPFSPPSAPSYCQRQHGPAKKGCDRQRAARHQAALAAQSPPATNVPVITADVATIAPVEPTVSVTTPEVAATPPVVTANSSASIFPTFTNPS